MSPCSDLVQKKCGEEKYHHRLKLPLSGELILTLIYLKKSTSPSPSNILTMTKAVALQLAIRGVNKLKMAVFKTPPPNSHFAPIFSEKNIKGS